MAKKSKRKQKEKQRRADEQMDEEIRKAMSEPWIAKRSGLSMMALLSVAFAAFMIWQLYPTEGTWRAIMWGLGSAVVLWLIFLLALGFNKLVRR